MIFLINWDLFKITSWLVHRCCSCATSLSQPGILRTTLLGTYLFVQIHQEKVLLGGSAFGRLECGMIWDVALLPEPINRKSEAVERAQAVFLDSLADGKNYKEIAEQLAKGDPRKAKNWRQRFRNWVIRDEEFAQQLAAVSHAEVVLGTPSIAGALVRRASKGNIPAAKLAFEASGFHYPRVKHEHTGDIKVTIANAPRPPEVVDEQVSDAEVVE
jgi:hypothetical protein